MFIGEEVTIGSRIKKIRQMKGLTQKQLGDRVGLSDVRIRQYEIGTRTPKPDVLERLAGALDVEISSISAVAVDTAVHTFHDLFMIEDRFGLHPVKVGDDYLLSFYTEPNLPGMNDSSITNALKQWYMAYEHFKAAENDTPDQVQEKKQNYDLWRYRYPKDDMEQTSERLRRHTEMDRLRERLAELEELDKKDKSE